MNTGDRLNIRATNLIAWAVLFEVTDCSFWGAVALVLGISLGAHILTKVNGRDYP